MPRHFAKSPSCVACRQRLPICVCALAPRLELATRLVLFIHSTEWGRSTNTGHLLRLAVRDVDIRVHGWRRRHGRSAEPVASAGSSLVLFPRRSAQVLTPELVRSLRGPITLIVPDGNWNQATSMMRRVPALQEATAVRLDGESIVSGPLRRNRDANRRSTFEAIARAVGVIEGEDAEERMLAFFREVLARRNGETVRGG
jgi:DTW domain-containing protein YfiP